MEMFENLEPCEHGVAKGKVCSFCVEQAECEDMFGGAKDLKVSEDRKINLCDNCFCRNNFPLCTPDEEGFDVVFGEGLGSDNIVACRNYEGDHFD